MFTLLYVTDEMRYAIRVIKEFSYHSLCCIRPFVVHSQCSLTRPLPKTQIENLKLEENPCSAKGGAAKTAPRQPRYKRTMYLYVPV